MVPAEPGLIILVTLWHETAKIRHQPSITKWSLMSDEHLTTKQTETSLIPADLNLRVG